MARYDSHFERWHGGYDRDYRPRVSERYNRDYVTGPVPEDARRPNHARWGGVRNHEAASFEPPYETIGGTRTRRGGPPHLWREEEARREGYRRERHPGRPWWAGGPGGYDERAGLRRSAGEGWRPRYSPVGGMQPGAGMRYDRDLPRDVHEERWFSDRTRWF